MLSTEDMNAIVRDLTLGHEVSVQGEEAAAFAKKVAPEIEAAKKAGRGVDFAQSIDGSGDGGE